MGTPTYNAKQYTITWGPIVFNDGAPASGDFATMRRTTASSAFSPGLNSGCAVMLPSPDGSIDLVQQAHATNNGLLSDILRRQESEGRIVSHPLLVQDFNGETVHKCENAYLQGFPEDSVSADAEPQRTWTLLLPDFDMNQRGSSLS